MSKSGPHQRTAASSGGHQDGDFLSFSHDPSSGGAQGWRASSIFNDSLSHPSDSAPALGAQRLGTHDLILVESGWSAFAKGSSKPVGGDPTSDGYTPQPYTTSIAGSDYNIRIEFKGTWTPDLYNGFTQAANLLCTYITGDVPDVFFRGKIIDDIVITAELKAIDGPGGILGQAGPTALRTGSYLPATAKMEFDSADASRYLSAGLWDDIVFHEMTHSLGFGSIWSYLGLSDGATFDGTQAMLAYGEMSKYNPDGDGDFDPLLVPVETDGGAGTAGSHWDEETFKTELMTGYIGYLDPTTQQYTGQNYISDITWASLQDLGYQLKPYPDSILM